MANGCCEPTSSVQRCPAVAGESRVTQLPTMWFRPRLLLSAGGVWCLPFSDSGCLLQLDPAPPPPQGGGRCWVGGLVVSPIFLIIPFFSFVFYLVLGGCLPPWLDPPPHWG